MPGTSVTQEQHAGLRNELQAELRAHSSATKGELRIMAAEIRHLRLEADAARDEQRDDHAEVLRQLNGVVQDVRTLADAELGRQAVRAARSRTIRTAARIAAWAVPSTGAIVGAAAAAGLI